MTVRRRVPAVLAVAFTVAALAGCGGTTAAQVEKGRQACWKHALARWTPGSYAEWAKQPHAFSLFSLAGGHSERFASVRELVAADAAFYEERVNSPFGITGAEGREFAKVQQACGKLNIRVTGGRIAGNFVG